MYVQIFPEEIKKTLTYTKIKESENTSKKWTELRSKVFSSYPPICMCCGVKKEDGAILHVDHIKPRSKYPKLRYEFDNLQVLCQRCNVIKLDKDETDFRQLN
jgi:5-methylcytosine-specific restriction endonuclease McrA